MNQKGFANIKLFAVVVIVILVGAVAYFVLRSLEPVTHQPGPASSGEKIIKKVGEKEGSFLIQKINSASIEGLWYQEYPVGREVGEPRTLRIGDDIGYACEGVSEKFTSIDFPGQKVTFTKITSQPPYGGCPI